MTHARACRGLRNLVYNASPIYLRVLQGWRSPSTRQTGCQVGKTQDLGAGQGLAVVAPALEPGSGQGSLVCGISLSSGLLIRPTMNAAARAGVLNRFVSVLFFIFLSRVVIAWVGTWLFLNALLILLPFHASNSGSRAFAPSSWSS